MTTRSPSARVDDSAAEYTATTLLTADDLAARWQVKPSHVYRLTREKLIPTVRLGRYYRYRLAAVEQFEQNGGVIE